jgi:T5SS/PEP-CTERM-associated repeat protein
LTAAAAAIAALSPALARAAIVATGNTIPPFNLPDTIGSLKTATVDPGGTSNGGVYVGEQNPGTLKIDNGWTLNSSFAIVANQTTASFPSDSHFDLLDGSTWNVTAGDFDIGRAATASALVAGSCTLDIFGQLRLGTLYTGSGQMAFQALSTLHANSVVVGAAGAGTLTVGGATVNTQFVEIGRETTAVGLLLINGTAFTDAGGLTAGIGGQGEVDVGDNTTLTTNFANFGNDFNSPTAKSPLASSYGIGNVTGVTAVWHNTGGIGVGFNARGALTIDGGATVTSGFIEVSRYADDGELTIKGGSTVTLAPGGSFTGAASLIVATEAGSVGTANVSGAGTTVSVSGVDAGGGAGFLEVGRHGNGYLGVSGGAKIVTPAAILATEVGSIGSLVLSGTGTTFTVTNGGTLEVGRNGTSTMIVQTGAAVGSAIGRLALNAGASANVTLQGLGTRWTTSSDFFLGDLGTATLTASAGAALDVGGFLYVGNGAAGTSGTLDVTGATTRVTTANQIIAGNNGTGIVTVEDGGQLATHKGPSPTLTSGLLGRFANAQGTLTVTGAGSRWTGDGGVNVGFFGKGALNVRGGGRVDSVDGVLARLPGSTGDATLDGGGSTWAIANNLYVGGRPASGATDSDPTAGPGGVAKLTANAGAAVSVGNAIRLFGAGTIDLQAGGTIAAGAGPTPAAGTLRLYAGGALAGTGTVKGAVLNGGSVAPGDNAIGTLNVQGGVTQQPGGVLDLEVAGAFPGQSDLLDVTGSAALAGGTIHVAFLNGYVPQVNDTFTLITASAGAPTPAGGVTVSGVSNLQFQLLTAGNSLQLRVASPAVPVAQWDVDGAASWNGAGNWTGAVPDAPAADAQLLRKLTTPNANSTVTLDGDRTVGSLTFDNPNGYTVAAGTGGQLILNNNGQPATVRAFAGSHTIAAPVSVAAAAAPAGVNVTVDTSAKLTMAAGLAVPDAAVDKFGNGTLAVGGGLTVGALSVHAGVARLAPGGGATANTVATLAVDAPAALDVADGKLTVTDTPLATVRQFLVNGYAGGAWTGAGGVVSSTAAASDGETSVGYAVGGDGVVAGLAANSILVRYTKAGDATLDGAVDFNDLVKLAQNYNTTVSAATDSWWANGDFTYDGVVDFNDLVKLAQNYNTALPAQALPGARAGFEADLAAAFATASVPEPTGGAGLAIIAACGIGARRRRRRQRRR